MLERFELLWPPPSSSTGTTKIEEPPAAGPRRSPRAALLPIALVLGLSIVARALIGH